MAVGINLGDLQNLPLQSGDVLKLTNSLTNTFPLTPAGHFSFGESAGAVHGGGSQAAASVRLLSQNGGAGGINSNNQSVALLSIKLGSAAHPNPGSAPASDAVQLRDAHVVGWNFDGILFSGTNGGINQFIFIGDPGVPDAIVTDGGFGTLPGNVSFNTNTSDVPVDLTVALCFAAGTSIGTPSGGVAIEDLKIGDKVLVASGATRRVIWIGEMIARPLRHPRPNEVNPVCIRAGAFGDGLPVRDLRVSPGHALYVDGALVLAAALINGVTIVQQEVETVRYFHIELESHDVLLAEGLPCESYLDDGNRANFLNNGEAIALYGRIDPKTWQDACAPWIGAGPQLEALRNRLHARAEAMGFEVLNESGLHLVVDSARVEPFHRIGDRFWFQIPACQSVQLGSAADVLSHVVPGTRDHRRLGVALNELRVNGAVVDLSDAEMFGIGFYEVETHDGRCWRWTDGAAVLALTSAAPLLIEINLRMTAPVWKRSDRALRLVHVAN